MDSLSMDGPPPLDPRGLEDLARIWETMDLASLRRSFPTVEKERADRDRIIESGKAYVNREILHGAKFSEAPAPRALSTWEGKVRADLLRPLPQGQDHSVQLSHQTNPVAEVDTLIRATSHDRFISILSLQDPTGRSVLPTHGGYKTLPEGEFAALFVEGSPKLSSQREFYVWSICAAGLVVRSLINSAADCCVRGSGSASDSPLLYMAKFAIHSKLTIPLEEIDDLRLHGFEPLAERPRISPTDSHAYDFRVAVSLASGADLGIFRVQFQHDQYNRVRSSALRLG
jgi:hypothetical protein